MAPLVIQKLKEFMVKNHPYWLQRIHDRTWLGHVAINNLLNVKKKKYKPSTINVLYEFFKLERDDWYRENLKKWHQEPDSILGKFFREKRLQLGLSIHEVARQLKNIDDRTIHRIESGDSFPNFTSYTIIQLIKLYRLSEEEKNTIMWHLVLGHDMMYMYKKLIDDIGKQWQSGSLSA